MSANEAHGYTELDVLPAADSALDALLREMEPRMYSPEFDALLRQLAGYVEKAGGGFRGLNEFLKDCLREAAYYYVTQRCADEWDERNSSWLHEIGPHFERAAIILAGVDPAFFAALDWDEARVLSFCEDLKTLSYVAFGLAGEKRRKGRPGIFIDPGKYNVVVLVEALAHTWELTSGHHFTVRDGAQFLVAAIAYIDPAAADLPVIVTAMRRIAKRDRALTRPQQKHIAKRKNNSQKIA